MRWSIDHLVGYTLLASGERLGWVDEFYFDDASWTVRYMVVDTGGWHAARKVLISPVAFGTPDPASRTFPVTLSGEQVRASPSIDTALPVSRQHEIALHGYYAWPAYWVDGPWPPGVYSAAPVPAPGTMPDGELSGSGPQAEPAPGPETGDPHLRSTWYVTGYGIRATDGEIGHVRDFIVDDETWRIVCLVVGTGTWLPGRKVVLAPAWIRQVCWEDAMIDVDLTRDAIRHSPEFDPSQPFSAACEARLYDYYGQPRKPM